MLKKILQISKYPTNLIHRLVFDLSSYLRRSKTIEVINYHIKRPNRAVLLISCDVIYVWQTPHMVLRTNGLFNPANWGFAFNCVADCAIMFRKYTQKSSSKHCYEKYEEIKMVSSYKIFHVGSF